MKSKILARIFLISFFSSCTSVAEDSPPQKDNIVIVPESPKRFEINNSTVDADTSISIEINGEEFELEEIEEGVEKAIDITRTIVEAGTEMLENKKRRDSIKISQREKMIVYQLGFSVNSKKKLLEAFINLSDKENIYAFKKGFRNFVLVKYQDKSEAELDKELEAYKLEYGSDVKGEIKKIDLVRECEKTKYPCLTKFRKDRKNEIQLECLICK